MSYAFLLCEGAHDQEFLACVAHFSSGLEIVSECPRDARAFARSMTYKYVRNSDTSVTLIIAGADGVTRILGDRGNLFASQARNARSFGVMIDSDDVGVAARKRQVSDYFSSLVPAAANCEVNEVVAAPSTADDRRSFGLWVAPNCADSGSLDQLILRIARAKTRRLAELSEGFVDAISGELGHSWGAYRDKGALGAFGQRTKAGASLASSLQEREAWFDDECLEDPDVRSVESFMIALSQ